MKNEIEYAVDLKDDLYAYALQLTGNRHLANDLLQETFLRIIQKSGTYRALGSFEAWAKMVMKNIFLNSIKKDDMHRDYFVDYCERHSFAEPECENAYCANEILHIISLLPPRQAVVITLRIKGYKYHEIASKIGVTVECVKSRIFEAKKNIRKVLDN